MDALGNVELRPSYQDPPSFALTEMKDLEADTPQENSSVVLPKRTGQVVSRSASFAASLAALLAIMKT